MRSAKDNLDYSTRDYEGFRELMIEKLKEKFPEYSDFSDNDLGIILIELLAFGQDIQSYYIDRVANEIHLHTARERQNVIELCNNYGYTLRNATASEFQQVFEVIPTDTDIVIPENFVLYTREDVYGEQLTFETYEQLIIPKGCTGLEKDENNEYLYSVKVREGRTIEEEILGSSKGTANQEFYLWESPVIQEHTQIYVNEGIGYEPWEEVKDFLSSGANDKHYVLRSTSSGKVAVVFGNGTLGKIPVAYDDGILAKYRVGGGSNGNVTSNTITVMENPLADIVRTFNPYTAKKLGEDEESLELAKVNAIKNLRTLDRAVTLRDYKEIAFQLPFVLLSNSEELNDGRTVNVYLVSKYNKTLSTEELKEAEEFYENVKMIGTTPVIKNATYVPLNLNVTISKYNNDTTDYQTLVKDFLKDYFSIGNFTFKQSYSQMGLIRDMMIMLPEAVDINVNLTNYTELTSGDIVCLGTVTVNEQKVGASYGY